MGSFPMISFPIKSLKEAREGSLKKLMHQRDTNQNQSNALGGWDSSPSRSPLLEHKIFSAPTLLGIVSHIALLSWISNNRFAGVPWIWGGGISVYEVHPRIVDKVPKPGEFERAILVRNSKSIFSRDIRLAPLWCSVFLLKQRHFPRVYESCDLYWQLTSWWQPTETVRFTLYSGNRDRFEACMTLHGRILNGNEADQGQRGTSGVLGPRTEQFALGSLYYLINKKATMHR
uniref:Uncharacterized protein n=1 Tax=Coccidioides posadasii RMSCC 3488 TaxID=454284 RepID=A0A0J6F537_COCPO|nr:hypothetical protein CPAG_00752 [Coccidioides posadasii RMSCC 3488]